MKAMTNPATTRPLPTLDALLSRLRAELPLVRERYAVDRLAVFGSYARNEQRAGSDLDVLVTFHEVPGLLRYIELEQYLSDRLGVPVDLVMESALKPLIREHIQRDILPV